MGKLPHSLNFGFTEACDSLNQMLSVMIAILNRIVFMILSLLIGIYHFVSFLADAILEKLAKIRQSRRENEAPKKINEKE